MKVSRYFVLLSALLALCCACSKEPMENAAGAVTRTIPYSATVSHGPQTRATLSGSEFADDCYVFQNGDKLYVEYRDGVTLKLYGVLDLFSGAGTGTGRFEGELKCLDAFEPSGETLSATLVGPNAANGFFIFGNPTGDPTDANKIVTGVTYPSSVSYTTLTDLVQQYSYFTGTSTYSAKNFNNLTQQSVFLQFHLSNFPKKALANSSATTANVLIKKDASTLHTVTGVPIGNNANFGDALFSTVVQAGNAFAGAKIQIDDNLEDAHDPLVLKQGFSNDLNLETNHYYSVTRTRDCFRIKATQDGTTMTFKNTFSGGSGTIEYSEDQGSTWSTYTGTTFNLNTGEEVWFRGTRTDCNCAGNTQLFTANHKCYIAGDITSLLGYPETLPANAFRSAFSKGGLSDSDAEKEKNLPTASGTVNWVDIDPNDPLVLPASTGANCYMEMFLNCTSLTSAPALPATVLADKCYFRMFYGSGLTSIPTFPSVVTMEITPGTRHRYFFQMFQNCKGIEQLTEPLPVGQNSTLQRGCFEDMFAHCTKLTSVIQGLLPATTLAEDCYRGMFQDTGFSRAPDLLAPTLVDACYRFMFNGCTQLNYIKCLATNPSPVVANDNNPYTRTWLVNVAASGTFIKSNDEDMIGTWAINNGNGIPSDWTVYQVKDEPTD